MRMFKPFEHFFGLNRFVEKNQNVNVTAFNLKNRLLFVVTVNNHFSMNLFHISISSGYKIAIRYTPATLPLCIIVDDWLFYYDAIRYMLGISGISTGTCTVGRSRGRVGERTVTRTVFF